MEFFLHFLDQVERANGGKPEVDPATCFKFGIEDRILCSSSGKVAYNRRLDYILSLNIPLHEATNKGEFVVVASYLCNLYRVDDLYLILQRNLKPLIN